MIFDNMILPDNTLPMDNIIPAPNVANLQDMMTAQRNRTMPQSTTTLQDMLAQQNAALAQSNVAPPSQMPARNVNTAATAQAVRGSANNKAQAGQQLAQACFTVHEAVLYLDTHPNDQNALEYYRRKQQQLTQASENYQKVVGPIRACTVDTSSGGWRWVETPWPWEIEED